MKRVFIVHGWGGRSDVSWLLWLQQELKKKGYEAHGLNMPNTENPVLSEWLTAIQNAVGIVDEDTYFVGHSLGCISICRFLEQQKNKAGGCVFVAGFRKPFRNDPDVQELEPFIMNKINFDIVKKNVKYITSIQSSNDALVPGEVTDDFAKTIAAHIIIEKNKGHFLSCATLPVVLDELLKMK